jgi:hypothetical protein
MLQSGLRLFFAHLPILLVIQLALHLLLGFPFPMSKKPGVANLKGATTTQPLCDAFVTVVRLESRGYISAIEIRISSQLSSQLRYRQVVLGWRRDAAAGKAGAERFAL